MDQKQTPGRLSLQFLSEPGDVNFGGKVHGGAVMKWIDQAAYACAAGWAESYCVTVYVGGIRFFRPIRIGDLVRVDACLIYTGNSSMHIAIDVFSRPVQQGEFLKTTHCVIVFVALDSEGAKKPVRRWIPANEQERHLEDYALRLTDLRKAIDNEMSQFLR